MLESISMKRLCRKSTIAYAAAIFFVPPLAAQSVVSPDDIVAIALVNLNLVDKGRSDEVWKEASSLFKSKTPRETFVSSIAESRPSVVGAAPRSWSGVNRVVLNAENSTGMPPGVYVNVNFFARMTAGKMSTEQISFHLETDGRWRMTGYEYKILP